MAERVLLSTRPLPPDDGNDDGAVLRKRGPGRPRKVADFASTGEAAVDMDAIDRVVAEDAARKQRLRDAGATAAKKPASPNSPWRACWNPKCGQWTRKSKPCQHCGKPAEPEDVSKAAEYAPESIARAPMMEPERPSARELAGWLWVNGLLAGGRQP